jgi:hypothetical protein
MPVGVAAIAMASESRITPQVPATITTSIARLTRMLRLVRWTARLSRIRNPILAIPLKPQRQ